MLKLLKQLFGGSDRESSDNLSETDNEETKKCKRCLRKASSYAYRCPYCGCLDFHLE